MAANPDHYFDNDPECVFCGCFGPIEDNEPCTTREEIGRQVAFLIDKLQRLRKLSKRNEKIVTERPAHWGENG